MAGTTDLINMADEKLMRDPFRGYSRIREQAGVVRGVMPDIGEVWIVTRYDDVKVVLNDPRFVNNPANVPGMTVQDLNEQLLEAHETPQEYHKYRRTRMDDFDAAEHARLRGLVSQAFTARRVREMRPRVMEIAEELLDRLPGKTDENGVVDLQLHFSHALPDAVLCELVGIPEEDRERWHGWYTVVQPVTGQQEEKAEGWRDLITYTQALLDRRRDEPTDDLISAMIRAQNENGNRLSDIEMIAMTVALGLVVHQTTAYFISNGTAALLTHPDQLALLRENPDLIPQAVHELLRWCGTTILAARVRYATEDVEIGGVRVRKGEAVWPVPAGANWDPRKFDDPERLDITREPERRSQTHIAFGHGPHYCLGAALAQQDSEVAFEALLRRFPNLALAVPPKDLERQRIPYQWRLEALPVLL
jgi:cytochrome P450